MIVNCQQHQERLWKVHKIFCYIKAGIRTLKNKLKEKWETKLNELKDAQSQELTEEKIKPENEPKHKILWLRLIIALIAVTIVWMVLIPD